MSVSVPSGKRSLNDAAVFEVRASTPPSQHPKQLQPSTSFELPAALAISDSEAEIATKQAMAHEICSRDGSHPPDLLPIEHTPATRSTLGLQPGQAEHPWQSA
jgi:hypothetical protein